MLKTTTIHVLTYLQELNAKIGNQFTTFDTKNVSKEDKDTLDKKYSDDELSVIWRCYKIWTSASGKQAVYSTFVKELLNK